MCGASPQEQLTNWGLYLFYGAYKSAKRCTIEKNGKKLVICCKYVGVCVYETDN